MMVLFDVYILKGFTKIKYLKMELATNQEMDKIPRWESVRRPASGYLKDTFLLWRDNRGVDRGVIRHGVIGTAEMWGLVGLCGV